MIGDWSVFLFLLVGPEKQQNYILHANKLKSYISPRCGFCGGVAGICSSTIMATSPAIHLFYVEMGRAYIRKYRAQASQAEQAMLFHFFYQDFSCLLFNL
jgi:hypothetical protein